MDFFTRIPPLYTVDGKRAIFEPNTTHSSDGFYSSDTYADNLINYLRDREEAQKEKPFFAYLPFSAPHWPLQCSQADRDAYQGVYDEGPDALRHARLCRLKSMDLVDENVVAAEVRAPESREWEEMTAEEKRLSARAMETYAGMVTA